MIDCCQWENEELGDGINEDVMQPVRQRREFEEKNHLARGLRDSKGYMGGYRRKS